MRCNMNRAFKNALKITRGLVSKDMVSYLYSVAALTAASLDVWIKYQRCKELEEKKHKGQKIGF